jgi:hypothetical protein
MMFHSFACTKTVFLNVGVQKPTVLLRRVLSLAGSNDYIYALVNEGRDGEKFRYHLLCWNIAPELEPEAEPKPEPEPKVFCPIYTTKFFDFHWNGCSQINACTETQRAYLLLEGEVIHCISLVSSSDSMKAQLLFVHRLDTTTSWASAMTLISSSELCLGVPSGRSSESMLVFFTILSRDRGLQQTRSTTREKATREKAKTSSIMMEEAWRHVSSIRKITQLLLDKDILHVINHNKVLSYK